MSGNSRQRRTLRRALDRSAPWGRAVVRERRKAKRARYVLKRTTILEVGKWQQLKNDPSGAWYRVEGPVKPDTFTWDGKSRGTIIVDHPDMDGTFLMKRDGEAPRKIEAEEIP